VLSIQAARATNAPAENKQLHLNSPLSRRVFPLLVGSSSFVSQSGLFPVPHDRFQLKFSAHWLLDPQDKNFVSHKQKALMSLFEDYNFKIKVGKLALTSSLDKHPLTKALLEHPLTDESFYETVVDDISGFFQWIKMTVKCFATNDAETNLPSMSPWQERLQYEMEENVQNLMTHLLPELVSHSPDVTAWNRIIEGVMSTSTGYVPKKNSIDTPDYLKEVVENAQNLITAYRMKNSEYRALVDLLLDLNPVAIRLLDQGPLSPGKVRQMNGQRLAALKKTIELIDQDIQPILPPLAKHFTRSIGRMLLGDNQFRLRKIANLEKISQYLGLKVSDAVWMSINTQFNEKISQGELPFQVLDKILKENS
jgi:hypothetical protein